MLSVIRLFVDQQIRLFNLWFSTDLLADRLAHRLSH